MRNEQSHYQRREPRKEDKEQSRDSKNATKKSNRLSFPRQGDWKTKKGHLEQRPHANLHLYWEHQQTPTNNELSRGMRFPTI